MNSAEKRNGRIAALADELQANESLYEACQETVRRLRQELGGDGHHGADDG